MIILTSASLEFNKGNVKNEMHPQRLNEVIERKKAPFYICLETLRQSLKAAMIKTEVPKKVEDDDITGYSRHI